MRTSTMRRKPISPGQCRAARAILMMTREVLARKAQIANATLADFELGKRTPHSHTLSVIRSTLEEHGIVFINSGGSGARQGEGIFHALY